MSLLHFVSRVKLPDYMFEKEGKLSEFEYEVVQEHCYMAKELCEGIPDFGEVEKALIFGEFPTKLFYTRFLLQSILTLPILTFSPMRFWLLAPTTNSLLLVQEIKLQFVFGICKQENL